MRLLLDTSKGGSDVGYQSAADREANVADDQFFSDEQAARYEGENYQAGVSDSVGASSPGGQSRRDLMKKAKSAIKPAKSVEKKEEKKDQSKGFSFNKGTSGKKTSPLAGSESAKNNISKKNEDVASKKGFLKPAADENGKSKNDNLSKAKSLLKKSTDIKDSLSSGKKDPRQVAAQLADEYLGLGRKTGHLLYVIWQVAAVAGWMPPLFIAGIPGLIMLNLLLVSPKLVYKITVYILILIPGVGEVAKSIDEAGLNKVKITLSGLEKAAIIFTDIAVAILIFIIVAFIYSVFCYSVNSSLGTTAAAGADWWYNTTFFSEIKGYCKGL